MIIGLLSLFVKIKMLCVHSSLSKHISHIKTLLICFVLYIFTFLGISKVASLSACFLNLQKEDEINVIPLQGAISNTGSLSNRISRE